MSTHDPQKIIEDLRNNLASHDRSLCFLFGAGTSSAINIAPEPTTNKKREHIPLIPSIIPLTRYCQKNIVALGGDFSSAWDLLEAHCDDGQKDKNIENILSLIRSKIDAIGPGEKLLGLEKDGLEKIEDSIRTTIASSVTPKESDIPEVIPHHSFATWLKRANRTQPVEIFTTNYDLLFERALEQEQLPFFDGFVGSFEPFFHVDCLEDERFLPPKSWVRLWKIHGSVNWQIKQYSSKNRVVRTGTIDTGEMILPSHRKYDESRKQPYTALLDRLSKALNKDHSLLITAGYSFGDQHINSVIFSALENRPTANVIALQFSELEDDNELAEWALKNSNFTVLGKNAGVIGNKWGTWKLLRSVDAKTCPFMDFAFDSSAAIEEEGEALEGNLRLGDFNYFCKFLLTMERKIGEKL